MSPFIRRKDKYFHSTVQAAEDRRQKFHFCRNVMLIERLRMTLRQTAKITFNFLFFSCNPHTKNASYYSLQIQIFLLHYTESKTLT